jgi:hypothetical protein
LQWRSWLILLPHSAARAEDLLTQGLFILDLFARVSSAGPVLPFIPASSRTAHALTITSSSEASSARPASYRHRIPHIRTLIIHTLIIRIHHTHTTAHHLDTKAGAVCLAAGAVGLRPNAFLNERANAHARSGWHLTVVAPWVALREIICVSAPKFGSGSLSVQFCGEDQAATTSRARSRSSFARPYICRFTSLSFVISHESPHF